MFTVFDIIRDLILLVALFGLTIFVHELGHFLAAIWSGMVVDVFSIGFGPAIWKKKINGVLFKVSWIPLGGYVAIPQLDPAAMEAVQGQDGEKVRELPEVSAGKKIFVSLAGVTGNVLLATLLAWIIFWNPNVITEEGNTTIGSVVETSEAYAAGVRAGDRIVSVNGEAVKTWTDYIMLCVFAGEGGNKVSLELESGDAMKIVDLPTIETDLGVNTIDGVEKSSICAVGEIMENSAAEASGLQPRDIIREFDGQKVLNSIHLIGLVSERGGKTVETVIEREGNAMTVEITPKYNEELDRVMIGIAFAPVQGVSWMQYKRPAAQLKNDLWQIVRMLKALTTRGEAKGAAKGIGGPTFILFSLWIAIRASFMNAIGLIRFININLAVLNLLPIPVLDGGHLVFAIWEGITRRKLHPKFVNTVVNVFATILICLILFITVRDFFKIPKFVKALRGGEEEVQEEPSEDSDENAEDQ